MSTGYTQGTIALRIGELIRQHIESDTIPPLDADLLDDLAIDSLELVELGIKVEKDFGIKFPMAELRRCSTIEEIVQLVERVQQEVQLKSA